ncbi:MAG: SagB/ThcOx family dehydrogenase [Candidatus Geothermarchaeales archaeon]
MDNRDTQATWHYHNGTKHPNGYLMNPRHMFDPTRRPKLFKTYIALQPLPLPLDTSTIGVSALNAISVDVSPGAQDRIPDLWTLARILYFSAGITKRLTFPWGEMLFRAAACTGALYHIELYLVCDDVPDLKAGVYHFDPGDLALRQLRRGDYRRVLMDATGNEPSVAQAPAIVVCTDVSSRNSCKYEAREYRHAFWDSGTILGHTLAMSAAHEIPAKIIAGFVDATVNRLLDLDTKREAALALVPIGYAPNATVESSPKVEPLHLETEPISDHEIEFPAIREMHEASSLEDVQEVIAWRGATSRMTTTEPSGHLFPLHPHTKDEMSRASIERVIIRRGSTRRFSHEPITFRQLSTILERATRGVAADFLKPLGVTLNDLYMIVNAVDGLESGSYVFDGKRRTLELLQAGDLRHMAGHLALNQQLGADASVDIFFLADLNPILERLGNRGYRIAQLDASITASRLYLAAYAQRLGATGLTFFDDAVTEFFSPHAHGKSVMFLIALGKKGRRR